MKILKKSGKIVNFIPSKIKTSIGNSADDTNQIINEKEIDLIIEDVQSTLISIGRDLTSSYEVKCVVFETLNKYSYKEIAKSYILNEQ